MLSYQEKESDRARHPHEDRQQARRGVLVERRVLVYEGGVESWAGEEGVDEDKEGVEGGQGDVVASSSSSPPPPRTRRRVPA